MSPEQQCMIDVVAYEGELKKALRFFRSARNTQLEKEQLLQRYRKAGFCE
jgi:hypothetical protein